MSLNFNWSLFVFLCTAVCTALVSVQSVFSQETTVCEPLMENIDFPSLRQGVQDITLDFYRLNLCFDIGVRGYDVRGHDVAVKHHVLV